MAQPAKPRRRIVAQLVSSPLETRRDIVEAPTDAPGSSALPGLPTPQLDQPAQSKWAEEHLGKDRKVFVDLNINGVEVDWKQILKSRGVNPSKATAKQTESGASNDPLLVRGRGGRQENPWNRLLAKLEATYCVGALSDEDSEQGENGAAEASDSGSDAEEEGGEGGAKEGEGGEAGAKEGEGDGKASDGGEGGGGDRKKGGKKGERGHGDYDYFDPFIDDEEFVEFTEHDKRKPKHSGFFISKGEIERTEEMLPGYEDLEKEKGRKGGKRKAEEDGGAEAKAGSKDPKPPGEKKKRKQQEDGSVGDRGENDRGEGQPAKKKKKAAAAPMVEGSAAQLLRKLSIAEQARLAGQLAAVGVAPVAEVPASQRSGSQPPSAKKPHKAPYEITEDVRAAIERIKAVAAQQPAPPPAPEGDDGRKTRKMLPKPVKDALADFSSLYLLQLEAHGTAAANRIMGELRPSLDPFCSRTSLGTYLRGANKERRPKEAPVLGEEELRQLIAERCKPPQAQQENSDDDFQAPAPPRSSASPPGGAGGDGAPGGGAPAAAPKQQQPYWKTVERAVQQRIHHFMKQRLGAAPLDSKQGKLLQQEVANMFPPGCMGLADVAAMYGLVERREAARAARAAGEAKLAAAAAAAQATQAAQAAPQPTAGGPAAAAAPAAGSAPAAAAPALAAAALQPAASPAAPPADPRQEAPPAPGLSPAELFASLAVAQAQEKLLSPAKTEPQGGSAAPAAGSSQPAAQPDPAGPQQVTAAADAAAQAAIAAAEAQAQAGQAAAVPAAAGGPGALAVAGGQTGSQVPAVSEEECVKQAVAHGADEAAVREMLEASRNSRYALIYVKALMLAGPAGLTTAQVAQKARDCGWETWDVDKAKKNTLWRASSRDGIAFIGKNRYALKAFPNIVELPRPHKGKPSGGSGPSQPSAPAAPPSDNPAVGPTPMPTGAAP